MIYSTINNKILITFFQKLFRVHLFMCDTLCIEKKRRKNRSLYKAWFFIDLLLWGGWGDIFFSVKMEEYWFSFIAYCFSHHAPSFLLSFIHLQEKNYFSFSILNIFLSFFLLFTIVHFSLFHFKDFPSLSRRDLFFFLSFLNSPSLTLAFWLSLHFPQQHTITLSFKVFSDPFILWEDILK